MRRSQIIQDNRTAITRRQPDSHPSSSRPLAPEGLVNLCQGVTPSAERVGRPLPEEQRDIDPFGP